MLDCLGGVQFIPSKHQNCASVSCVSWSSDGTYLAVAENGPSPSIFIYKYKQKSIVSCLKGHQSTVRQVEFLGNNYLLTLGDGKDGSFYVWNWKTGLKKSLATFAEESMARGFCILDASIYLLARKSATVWKVDVTNPSLIDVLSENTGRNVFVGECCGTLNSSTLGYFIGIDRNHQKSLKKLASDKSYLKIDVSGESTGFASAGNRLAVSTMRGSIQIFDLQSGNCIANITPPDLFADEDTVTCDSRSLVSTYADCIALRILNVKRKLLVAFYANGAVLVWDMSNEKQIILLHHFKSHSGRVFGLEIPSLYNDTSGNEFYSCSEDGTVCQWTLESSESATCPSLMKRFVIDTDALEKPRLINISSPLSPNEQSQGLRTVKLSANGDIMFVFNRNGTLFVISTKDGNIILKKDIHDTEVIAMDVLSMVKGSTQKHLVASSGRDKIVHIYEISGIQSFPTCTHIQSIDDFTSSVTGIKFVYKSDETEAESAPNLQLITSGLDNSFSIRNIDTNSPNLYFLGAHTLHGTSGFADMDLESTHRYAVAATKDAKLLAVHLSSASKERCYQYEGNGSVKLLKKSDIDQESIKSYSIRTALDPSGTILAYSLSTVASKNQQQTVSGKERCIHLLKFFGGKSLSQNSPTGLLPTRGGAGHGSLITAIKFTNDCSKVVSADSDGLLFVWRISDEDIVSEMRERLDNLRRRGLFMSKHINFSQEEDGTPVKKAGFSSSLYLPAWARMKLGDSTRDTVKPSSNENFNGKWGAKVSENKELFRSQDWLQSGGNLLSPPVIKSTASVGIREKWRNPEIEEKDDKQLSKTKFEELQEEEHECEELPEELLRGENLVEQPVPANMDQEAIIRSIQEDFSLHFEEDPTIIQAELVNEPVVNTSVSILQESVATAENDSEDVEPVEIAFQNRSSKPRQSLSTIVRNNQMNEQKLPTGMASSIATTKVEAQSYLEFLRQEQKVRLELIRRDNEEMRERLKQLGLTAADENLKKEPIAPASPNLPARAIRRVLSSVKLSSFEGGEVIDQSNLQESTLAFQYLLLSLMNTCENSGAYESRSNIETALKDAHQKLTVFLAKQIANRRSNINE